MKIALEFLPRLRLNEILTSFALNKLVFSFFSFNFLYYFLYCLFIYFLPFLKTHFIVLEDSISPVLIYAGLCKMNLRRFTCTKKSCMIKKFWSLGLQPGERHVFLTGIIVLKGNSCSCSLHMIDCFLRSKLIDCQKDGYYKHSVIK